MMRYVLFAFPLACALAQADPYKVQQTLAYPAPVAAQKQEARQQVAVKADREDLFFNRFLAVQLLDVPTYSAVYVPAPPVAYQQPYQATAPASNELREVLEVLKSFDARLRQLEGRLPPVLPPVAVPPAGIPPMSKVTDGTPARPEALTVLATKCAVCHEAAVAGDRAGGVILFKGEPPVLTAAQRWREKMATAVEKGLMPEMGSAYALTSAEKTVLVDYLRSMR